MPYVAEAAPVMEDREAVRGTRGSRGDDASCICRAPDGARGGGSDRGEEAPERARCPAEAARAVPTGPTRVSPAERLVAVTAVALAAAPAEKFVASTAAAMAPKMGGRKVAAMA